MLAWPPIPGVDDQVADAPGRVVDEEILNMTNWSVRSLDVISHNRRQAPEVGVAIIEAELWAIGLKQVGIVAIGRRVKCTAHAGCITTEIVASAPERVPAVISVEVRFHLP